jgi:DNA anti-recombination protein RmuC
VPGFVRNASSFKPKISNYRRRYSIATNEETQRQIIANFTRNYGAWLTAEKAKNVVRRRGEQKLYNNIREALKRGNKAGAAKLAEEANKGTSSTPRRKARSAPTPRKNASLFKKMHQTRLEKLHKNLRNEINELERQRNALEAKINNVRRRIRELPSPHRP